MINYFAQRLGQALIVIFVVAVLAFLMFRFLGDPIVAILGANSTGLQRDALRRELGLDAPLLFQFADYLWQMLRGNFGLSYRLGQPVGQVLLERAPATIELAMSGMLLSLAVGIPAGIYTALHRRRISSQLTLGLSLVGISMPSFFMGILLIFVFSVRLGWLPSFGRGETVSIGWWSTGLLTISGLKALVMPAITISVFQIAMIMRLVRAEMLEVMRMDYIRFARARGLSNRAVHLRHALGNTLVPVITITGLQLGSVIAFAVITEQVFQWPGLGLLFLQSVAAADVPVIAAYLVLIALVFVVINLIVDLLYYVIDPRLQSLITNGSRA
ncbi:MULTISPECIES: ABC transporter permease [unclassified Chelatococcus]|uniref:ABC transporter permease n=1 Tax=unclassified Chelatococcus TaxID=2638111 RepID=UPI001BCE8A95|nr:MULTISPECIES: ABC transporter permease [unclassified Chelatococcus]CAH1654673.1 ABC transporter permease [Hyphomicrobiales bacterium]MBS7742757.1 ABC transporter permease [Chelatococcus sp. HY11]MBX3542125.1 ABC transporter permease [Chelatococcus sp.]MCO5075660.1 ABC transporter permease [Chelatococcus sp.]CAH1695008.1 ABC transporter permease [Hyphomicrobiales bacterium]